VNQRDTIVRHLQQSGSISPLEARHVYGIERLASRIDELRQCGHSSETNIKRDARNRRYAEYRYAPVKGALVPYIAQ